MLTFFGGFVSGALVGALLMAWKYCDTLRTFERELCQLQRRCDALASSQGNKR